MSKTATLNVRVDLEDKQNAELVLKDSGLSMSTLITVLLKQVSYTKSVPFDIALPPSIDSNKLNKEELKTLLVDAYHEVEAEDTLDADTFFENFRGDR